MNRMICLRSILVHVVQTRVISSLTTYSHGIDFHKLNLIQVFDINKITIIKCIVCFLLSNSNDNKKNEGKLGSAVTTYVFPLIHLFILIGKVECVSVAYHQLTVDRRVVQFIIFFLRFNFFIHLTSSAQMPHIQDAQCDKMGRSWCWNISVIASPSPSSSPQQKKFQFKP